MMGVFDAAIMAMRGGMDWNTAYGTIDHLRERVAESGKPAELHLGNLFSGPHFHDPQAELMEHLDAAQYHIDEAQRLCYVVLEAL